MIINLEDGELTPSPTEREPPVLKLRQPVGTSSTHLDDDPEIARLYQEALHTLPDTKVQREINHRVNGQASHAPSIQVNKKRKRKRAKNPLPPNHNFSAPQRLTCPDGTSISIINSPGKRKRDSSVNSNSNNSRGNAKRSRHDRPNNLTGNKTAKKPTPPKMPSTLAAEVSRYFNTSKKMQYLFDMPSANFVEGVGTFNAEEIFETVWDITVNELQKLDNNCKELHMETIIAENMVQEQMTFEKKTKRELADAQGKYMKNVNYTDISSGHLRLPAKLSEAMMKHDCCVKILEELKEQYTLKFNKYQIVAGSLKRFITFHKHLLEYKKMHDNFLLEMDAYNQDVGEYNIQYQRNDVSWNDEEKSLDGNAGSDFSEHSSDMSLCSRNSSFCPPPSPPLFNDESYPSTQLLNALPSSNGFIRENVDNYPNNSQSFNNNFQKSVENLHQSNMCLISRCQSSGEENKQRDFVRLERNFSGNLNGLKPLDNSTGKHISPNVSMEIKTNMSYVYNDDNSNSDNDIIFIEEVSRPQLNSIPPPPSALKDGNSSFARSGSWTNMQTYTKNNGVADDPKRRQFMYPLPINNCSNSWTPPSCNEPLLSNLRSNDSIEPQINSVKDKENGVISAVANKYDSSVDDINELLCYYDLYGQCKDNKCKSLHAVHRQVLMDCIDYCVRSNDISSSLPKPNDETLAYFVFTVLRENNYNYNETINRLHNFVNNGYK
uniref:C3H1-type domain-containing protein n=1 Tax=Strongyloides venezuelensis TaxID=75913 RepID=A0A0K0F5T7_STRVS